ncbi:50S ribosomal protein L9 [Blastococcus sp. Marseille-P5729]|uniref:50S ribosomal protein L9 n=1 Tax=Blastococcus sp. Marseille-P5729 TaxID=2086582 RepID=UPI001F451237|nr:50S ribosomal protein L9 [Blastococcus sp. Marseille-P5729]
MSNMKLILTQEVTGLGAPGDVVEVKSGYGRNYLIPRGYAMVATKGGEKQIAQIKRAREVRGARDLDHAKQIASQLEGLSVKHAARAGSDGRLFGSVTSGDIVEAVKAAGGPELDKRRVELPSQIKSTGTHDVNVKIHDEVTGSFKIEVVAAS